MNFRKLFIFVIALALWPKISMAMITFDDCLKLAPEYRELQEIEVVVPPKDNKEFLNSERETTKYHCMKKSRSYEIL
jgi:hypothetical protein